MTENEKNEYPQKVVCPYCGYEMPIWYDESAESDGVTVTCKGRNCHSVFEIKIKFGEQIK